MNLLFLDFETHYEPHGIGVTDGHRYCANIARRALAKIDASRT